MSNFLAIQFLFFATNFIVGESQELPLIFNTRTNKVVNLNQVQNSDENERYAIACPIQENSIPEKKFRDLIAFSKNMLFVKKIYPKLELINEMNNLEICETPFQASVVINKVTEEVELGFELYYEESFEELNVSPHEKYAPITNLPTKLPKIVRQVTRTFSKSFTFPRDGQKINFYEKKMDFLWIPMYNLSFDDEHLNPKHVTYETQVYFPDPSKTCQNYELAGEIYKDIEMDKIYEEKNLDEIFEDIVKPTKSENENENFFPEFATESGHVCVTQTNLIPDKYFYFSSTKSLSCSYLTTVPIWCNIADGLLKQLDEYIDILTEKLHLIGGKLRITSGTNGILHMTKKYKGDPAKAPGRFSLKKFTEKMYLVKRDKNNKIPMSTSVYKIIEYESSKCPENQKLCWYSIVIEISNNPYTPTKDGICKDSGICLEWGWGSVFNKDQADHISCCENSPEVKKKLGLAKDEKKNRGNFNLKTFSIQYISENDQPVYKPLNVEIDERIAELRPLVVQTSTSDQSHQKEATDPIQ